MLVRSQWTSAAFWVWLGTGAAIVGLAVLGNGGALAGLVAIPVLLVLIRLTVFRTARRETRFDLAGIVLFAASVHFAGALARWFAFTQLYDGNGDAGVYHDFAVNNVAYVRSLDFGFDPAIASAGTANLRRLTTILYALVGTDQFVGYLVFTTLAFVGLWWCYRAFALAVPGGRHERYAKLVLLWPSLVFWPSSIGKDAFMIFALGLAAMGTALLFAGRRSCVVPLALGVTAGMLVRPHVMVLFLVAATVAFALRPAGRVGGFGLPGKLVTLAVLMAFVLVGIGQASRILGIEEVTPEGLQMALDNTEANTTVKATGGGSEFTPARVRTPLDLPWATATILVRPFPFEVRNIQSLVASLEGVLMLGLLASSWRALITVPRQLRWVPYVALCLVFAIGFVWAFSSFGNFGLLARQRTQLLPFALALACLPVLPRSRAARLAS